ncbi:MAG: flagellar basal body P-ring formation chaperone FlgA [Planctomycetaceae bacterium]|jgi:flagella basal body P-ring formation protein FlgA|nr:flagellar basal body P-ring formation chaperone FlgA [Planctomycetaceae bacterium]
MKRKILQIIFICLIIFTANFVFAAEIRLQGESRVADVFVRLGDVAEIISNSQQESERLKQIILFPTPQNNDSRTVNFIEIRNTLIRLGINVFDHNFTGAKKITIFNINANSNSNFNANANANINANANSFARQNIYSNNAGAKIIQANHHAANNNNTPITPATQQLATQQQLNLALRNIQPDFIKQMEKIIAEAIRIHLRQRTQTTSINPPPTLNVSVRLTREQTLALATNGQINEIEGGAEPFNGKQKFQIKLQRINPKTNQNFSVPVDANLIPVIQCVTTVRNLPKGYIINESDLKIAEYENINFNNAKNKNEEYFINIKDVAGKEVTSNLQEGSIITQAKIKRPTWVRKGDVVTIIAKNSGVVIRTIGIAKSDGSEGDTIFVTRIEQNNTQQKIRNRKQTPIELPAVVIQPKIVEINATPISLN